MTPTIDHAVPIPTKNPGKWTVLAWRMGPGDSVQVEKDRDRSCLMRALEKRHVISTSRKVDGVGFRVWRVT